MNPALINAAADEHIRELRHHAARRRDARRHAAARHREPRPPRLRSHLGFALVEAGFYLLASARLASRD